MKHRIITISREYGSGGGTIGQRVAEKLGIPWYNRDIVEKLIEEDGFSLKDIENEGEYSKGFFSYTFSKSRFEPMNTQDRIWMAQSKIIRTLADQGDCVIVGRCADFVLRDKHDCLNVFIHADLEDRKKHISQLYGKGQIVPDKALLQNDKRRANYYSLYTDITWGKAKNYDLCLNSSSLGYEKCMDIICQIYNK